MCQQVSVSFLAPGCSRVSRHAQRSELCLIRTWTHHRTPRQPAPASRQAACRCASAAASPSTSTMQPPMSAPQARLSPAGPAWCVPGSSIGTERRCLCVAHLLGAFQVHGKNT